MSVTIRARATIANFGPGFDVFGLALEGPCDKVRVKPGGDEIRIKLSGMADGVPVNPPDNTAGLAVINFLKGIGEEGMGVDIAIKKGIRTGAGLGSSGACAAASVHALNKLFGSALTPNRLIEFAMKGEAASGVTHADNVSACSLGGFTMIKNFDPIEVEKIEVPSIPIVICTPLVHLQQKKTAATRRVIPASFSLMDAREQISACSSLVHAMLGEDLRGIGRAVNRDHISEPVRSRFIPGYWKIKRAVLKAGAYGCNISGGAPSIFAIVEKEEQGEIAELMVEGFKQRGIESEAILTKASNRGCE